MKKNIWVLSGNRTVLVQVQRQINRGGGMRAVCLFSDAAVEKAMAHLGGEDTVEMPSLFLVDYEDGRKNGFTTYFRIKNNPAFAGIPVFFLCENRTQETDEECYELGGTVVLVLPFSDAALLRMEKAAWQHEMTRNYEKLLQKQAAELATAKEIKRLNEQLAARNELLHQVFGKYFSDEVVQVILEHPEGAAIGGQKRYLTVMMADLRGFTSLSDRLPAETVIEMINHFLGEMTEVIQRYRGTVIEFIGDAILAVFGAPLASECPQADAVAAAVCMQNKMRDVNAFNQEKGYPAIEMGIGIHAGEVFIGNIGSESLMRYNVIGQAVNLCSRVESYSVGGQILASMETLRPIEQIVSFRRSFEIAMKGIREKIPVCEITGIAGAYECSLLQEQEAPMTILEDRCVLSMYVLLDKQILGSAIPASVHAISEKEIVLQMLPQEKAEYPDVFTDVELVLDTQENAYAKIVEAEGNRYRLHFTFLSGDFLQLVTKENADKG